MQPTLDISTPKAIHFLQKSEAPRPVGGASRKRNLIFNCAPRPRLQGGACGALAGQTET
jgi:hypothetical protein